MSDEPTNGAAPVTQQSAQAQLEAEFQRILAADVTAKACRRRIAAHKARIRAELHQLELDVAMLRNHSRFLKDKAADNVRDALGITVIPGFKDKKPKGLQYRQTLAGLIRQAEESGRSILET